MTPVSHSYSFVMLDLLKSWGDVCEPDDDRGGLTAVPLLPYGVRRDSGRRRVGPAPTVGLFGHGLPNSNGSRRLTR